MDSSTSNFIRHRPKVSFYWKELEKMLSYRFKIPSYKERFIEEKYVKVWWCINLPYLFKYQRADDQIFACKFSKYIKSKLYCTARQYSPIRRKNTEWTIINPALSLLMKNLVIGQRQKTSNFSAFHWLPRGSLVSIGQHFITTRVVHLPKRTETSLITESDRSRPNDRIGLDCVGRAKVQ